jgi:VanZ family protein
MDATTHLGLLVVFATFVSIAFAVLMRDEPREQLKFGCEAVRHLHRVRGSSRLVVVPVTAVTRGRMLPLWAPVIAYMALIFFISAQPSPPLPSAITDKQGHSLGYMGLAIITGRALAGGARRTAPSLGASAGAWLVASAYAATDEWHQSFVPGRSADLHDWYADAIGRCSARAPAGWWGIIRSRADV